MNRKLFIISLGFLIFSHFVFSKTKQVSAHSQKQDSEKETSYSFRPLLIQGKKRFSEKSKDLKVEGESIVESEIFSIKINFKDRIFESGSKL